MAMQTGPIPLKLQKTAVLSVTTSNFIMFIFQFYQFFGAILVGLYF
jgi:hypothetical protein